MKTFNCKALKNRRRYFSRIAAGRFIRVPCRMCYGCRHGLPCAYPRLVWFPF